MIRKKSIFYFVLITFLFSQSDLFGMLGFKNKNKQPSSSRAYFMINFLPKFMAMKIDMKLGGKIQNKSVKAQWKRFIKHYYPNEIDFNNIPNSVSAFYNSFVKEIDENQPNNKVLFLNLFQQSNTNNVELTNFSEFLNLETVKAAFMKLGKETIVKLQDSSENDSSEDEREPVEVTEPVVIKVKKWSTMTNEKAVETLLQPDVNPLAEKTIAAAEEILNFEDGEKLTRNTIEQAYEQELAELMSQRPTGSMEAEKQQEAVQALDVAREVLKENVEPVEVTEPVVIKVKKWSTMTNDKAVETLLQPDVNPLAKKTIAAAEEILNFEDGEKLTRNTIEQAYQKELAELMRQRPTSSMEVGKQQEAVQAVDVAKEVLKKNLEVVEVTEPVVKKVKKWSTMTNDKANKEDSITPEIHEIIKKEAAGVAQKLIKEGKSLQHFQAQLLASNQYSSEQIAYMLGYVEFHMKSLQVTTGNAVQQIEKIADVLKVLNNQVARNA